MSEKIAKKYLKYKNKMDKLPNDTVLERWGMYSQDERYRDETLDLANDIKKDMKITHKQAMYMLYYMSMNGISDYNRAKNDMMVDKNFEMYSRKHKG